MPTRGKSGRNTGRPSWLDKELLSSRGKKKTTAETKTFFLERKKTFRKWKRGQVALKDYREIPWPGDLGLEDL